MSPQEYIESRLNGLKKITDPPQNASKEDLPGAIFVMLMSKKFRKYAVTQEYQNHIRSAIKLNVSRDEPIKLTLVFGGYKLWRLPEAPEVDWAELFSLIYYTQWITPIAKIYKPGIWFDFYSDDAIVDLIDNIPRHDIETYLHSFRHLLAYIKQFTLPNITFTLTRVGDQYPNREAFLKELSEKLAQTPAPELSGANLKTLHLNVRPLPGREPDYAYSQQLHDAYVLIDKRRPYYRTPDKVMVITKQLPNTIAVGTTKTSIVKFWIGAGALIQQGDTYRETVLPPTLCNEHAHWQTVDLVHLMGKNFHRIRIV